MLTTRQKVLRRFWYPVFHGDLLSDGPKGFVLMGERIVLWRQEDGTPVAIQDRCCHRTAQLSLGYLERGRVVCGYHGWEYDGTGRCVRIPQAKDPERPNNMRVDAYHCVEKYGYVWVALDDPLTEVPHIPEAEEPGLRKIDQFYEVWHIGALRLMENSFDNAHIAFTHRESFGTTEAPIPSKNEIVEGEYGFDVYTEIPVKNPAIQKKNLKTDSEDTVRSVHATWFLPFQRRLGITYPTGLRHTIITCATPMTDDRAMIVQWCYRSDAEDEVPAADVIAFDRQVTMEDKIILETTEYDVPLDPASGGEFSMPSDKPGVIMRRKLKALLEAHGETEVTMASPAPAAAVLDRQIAAIAVE